MISFLYMIWGNVLIHLHMTVQFSQHHLLKGLSFLQCIFLLPLLWINWLYVHGFTSEFSALFHWSISLFLCQYDTVLITEALQYCVDFGRVMLLGLFFFFRIVMAILGLLQYHIKVLQLFLVVLWKMSLVIWQES